MLVFKHPKYYEELRKKAKKFQKEERERNAKEQATSKQQAASVKQQAIEESVPYTDVIEANGDSDKSDS
tara:strand:- start:156 stop:362 length:207 start_codon:yes stop_codon:yes gene_type:complete